MPASEKKATVIKGWDCALCGKTFPQEQMAIYLRFGYVDCTAAAEDDFYDSFEPEEGLCPVCDQCAITYIKGDS